MQKSYKNGELVSLFENLGQIIEHIISTDSAWRQPVVAALIIFLSLLVRGLFTHWLFGAALQLSSKTKTELGRGLLLAYKNPLRWLILVVGIYIALSYLGLSAGVAATVTGLFRSFLIIFFTWGLYNLAGGEAYGRISKELKIDRIISEFATKVLRFLIFALALAIIAQEWDYDVNGFLAGLGLGGLAFALAAKDTVANIFGGVIIILDKPFAVGDWILTPSVEGTVEEMSFRSTKVRTFANALATVPNQVVANEAITNWSRMRKRRVVFNLGVTYGTSREKLQACIVKIKELLVGHPAVHPDTIFVCFDRFNDSSLDIFIYYFTNTTIWGEFLKVKEEINLKIMEVLEGEGVSVAFPSRSLYFENALNAGLLPPASPGSWDGESPAE